MGGGPSGENSKEEEHSARFYGGRNSGQVLGRPPKGGKGGGTLSKCEKLAPLRFLQSKDRYGRSIFFLLVPGQYWIKKQGKGENVLFPTDSTDSPRAGHTSSVRLYRGGNRTTGKDRGPTRFSL